MVVEKSSDQVVAQWGSEQKDEGVPVRAVSGSSMRRRSAAARAMVATILVPLLGKRMVPLLGEAGWG